MFKNMIKGLIALLLVVGLTGLPIAPGLAQTATTTNNATQIIFASSSSPSTFKGNVVRGDRNTYAFAGKKGQSITLNITSLEKNVVFDVIDSSGKTIKSEVTSWTGSLLADGNYKVLVGGTRGNASYTLTAAQVAPGLPIKPGVAQAAPTTNKPTTVTFASGSISSTFKGGVVLGDRSIFLLPGQKDQSIELNITSAEKNAVFDVFDPSGKVLKSAATLWTGSATANGDYKIVVGGTRGNTNYALTVEQVESN
jgi:hypothetical protein